MLPPFNIDWRHPSAVGASRWTRAMLAAAAQAVAARDRRIAELRAEVAELRAEIARLRLESGRRL